MGRFIQLFFVNLLFFQNFFPAFAEEFTESNLINTKWQIIEVENKKLPDDFIDLIYFLNPNGTVTGTNLFGNTKKLYANFEENKFYFKPEVLINNESLAWKLDSKKLVITNNYFSKSKFTPKDSLEKPTLQEYSQAFTLQISQNNTNNSTNFGNLSLIQRHNLGQERFTNIELNLTNVFYMSVLGIYPSISNQEKYKHLNTLQIKLRKLH
jgi:hypothetical protein